MSFDMFAAESGIPVGVIIMWSGLSAPFGWKLCDGTDGTPDLRNRFIIGSSGNYASNSTGGYTEYTPPAHSHPVTTNSISHNHYVASSLGGGHSHTISLGLNGAHQHTTNFINSNTQGYGVPRGCPGTGSALINAAQGSGSHTHNITVYTNTSHNHGSNTLSNVSGHSHSINTVLNNPAGFSTNNNNPPYFKLAFLVKV